MRIETTPIDGLLVIHPRVFEDDRGFFYESYNQAKFREAGILTSFAQDNHALSRRDTLRGLHFQLGPGQAKLVRCTHGHVWDVAVDIRPDSPTCGRWFAVDLTGDNRVMFFIPEGFAHGYCVLSETAEFLYKCSTVYDPALESEIRWDDPDVGVAWPLDAPLLSPRDRNAQGFREYMEKLRKGEI